MENFTRRLESKEKRKEEKWLSFPTKNTVSETKNSIDGFNSRLNKKDRWESLFWRQLTVDWKMGQWKYLH